MVGVRKKMPQEHIRERGHRKGSWMFRAALSMAAFHPEPQD